MPLMPTHTASTGVDVERELILYGQSIGSAPTLYLATRRRVAGTVLHTPILSGLRFLIPPSTGFCSVGGCCSPVCVYALCDPFPNFKRIKRVSAPVFLIHGTADQTVHHSHTLTLYERLPPQHRREPYIVNGAGHENIVDFDAERYFGKIREFLLSVVDGGEHAQGEHAQWQHQGTRQAQQLAQQQGRTLLASDSGDGSPPQSPLLPRNPAAEPSGVKPLSPVDTI